MNPNEHAACAREIAQCYEDIRERDAEIERLSKRLDEIGEKETYKEWQRNQAELSRLKKLCTLAADALACYNLDHLQDDLIDELRKAVE